MNGEPRPGGGSFFDAIAGRYDRLNRLLSLGADRGWRRAAVEALDLGAAPRVLDLACGTGDLALELHRRHPEARIVGVDPSAGMLSIAAGKLRGGVQLVRGEAEHLPLSRETFDAVTIAFGIRNVPDRMAGLREMARVCRPGGRIAILELGEPDPGLLSRLAGLWIHQAVPRLGAVLGRGAAYGYLRSSIGAFPPPDRFVGELTEAGLTLVSLRSMSFGACRLFVATPG